jgi:type 1 fimbria pilin
MTTSTMNHHRFPHIAAATGVIGILFATTLTSASAMPGRGDPPTIAGTVHSRGHYVGHGCFITPHTWSEALAGPLPRCYTYVP